MMAVYILVVAVSLAMDAFAASLSCGMTSSGSKRRLAVKVGVFFGSFQFIAFVSGWMIGSTSKDLFSSFTSWLAFILLAAIGIRMIIEAVKGWKENRECKPLSNRSLVILSVATSIDALFVGLSFGFIGGSILISALVVGLITLVLSFAGVLAGGRIRVHLGNYAEILAGLVLIGIGIRILAVDLF